jgi:hypothetical protein
MEKLAFTRVNLSDVRVIMVIMRVFMEELLCQAVMERIPVLEYPLSSVHGHLRLCPVVPGIKCCHFLRTRLQGHLPGTEEPPRCWCWGPKCVLSQGVRIRPTKLKGGEILRAHGFQDGERTGMDYS